MNLLQVHRGITYEDHYFPQRCRLKTMVRIRSCWRLRVRALRDPLCSHADSSFDVAGLWARVVSPRFSLGNGLVRGACGGFSARSGFQAASSALGRRDWCVRGHAEAIGQCQKMIMENNFKTIDSVIDFVTFRLEIGSEVLAQNKDSLFNIALFRYIESNDIIICSAYEMFFDACLNLSYITEAQNFYDKYNHYFTDTSQAQAKEKLNRLKSVFFPSYVGALNHQLIELANSEEINFEVLDITDAETYSDLEKTSVELLKKFTLVNPSLTLKIFDCFVNVGFLTPHMFKYRGMAFLTLGLQNDGVMAFQEYISFIEGSIDLIDLIDLSVSNKKEVELIVTSDLKNKIYDHIENQEYSSAATFLADFILCRSFFSALNNPELRYLIFDHKNNKN